MIRFKCWCIWNNCYWNYSITWLDIFTSFYFYRCINITWIYESKIWWTTYTNLYRMFISSSLYINKNKCKYICISIIFKLYIFMEYLFKYFIYSFINGFMYNIRWFNKCYVYGYNSSNYNDIWRSFCYDFII